MPFTSKGFRIYYERHGAGEPLLLVTGFTISAAVFDPILPLYSERFECLVYDNRGSGRSSTPLRPTSIPEMAADAVQVLDELGIESAHVYGLSMGGMIAQEIALRFPDRVRGLILGGTTTGGPRAVIPSVRELGTLLRSMGVSARSGGRPWTDSAVAGAVFSKAFRDAHPERTRELASHFTAHRARPHGIAGHWWATVYHDTYARLPEIQAPTLVMHGELDEMAPIGTSRLLANRIPDAELVIIPESGHAYPLELPEESFAALTEWLDRRAPIPAGRDRTDVAARIEPLTRVLGLPIGALRTGHSLIGSVGARARRALGAGGDDDELPPPRGRETRRMAA